MLAAVLGWVLPSQTTPSLLHKWPKGRFGLHAIVVAVVEAKSLNGHFAATLHWMPQYIERYEWQSIQK